MIHYTLLPEKEMRSLKREYRTRLLIFFLFFLSCSILIGILALVPAYYFSYSQEKESINRFSAIQKSRQEQGTTNLIKELSQDSDILKKLSRSKESVIWSQIISEITNHKATGITITSLALSKPINATSTIGIALQGKASTRDALIQFKNKLEADPSIVKVGLPVSDLAKSKDIMYSITISIISNL